MCSPTMFLGMQAAGVGMQTGAAFYSARAQKSALNTQASIADTNARIAELSAQDALMQGQRQEQAQRLKTAQTKSAQRVAMAANGIDLGSDTAVNILTSTDLLGEIDADTVAANAARSAFGYRTQAVNSRNDALMSRASARPINPWMAAGSTMLTGASDVAKSHYAMNKVGLFDNDVPAGVRGQGNDVLRTMFGRR